MLKRALLAGLGLIALSTPAQAAVVRLQFSGEIDEFNSYFQSSHFDAAYSAEQRSYMGGINRRMGATPGSTYDFVIQYDSDAAMVGGRFAFDLVSGRVGAHTDFSDFTRFAQFAGAGAYTYLNFVFEKSTGPGGTKPIYAIFNIGDNDGDVVAGALPSVVDPTLIDRAGASFEARGGFVSPQYRSYSDGASLRVLPPPGPIGGGVGAAPEPGTWALMILGFGLAGAGLRKARTGSADSRATLS